MAALDPYSAPNPSHTNTHTHMQTLTPTFTHAPPSAPDPAPAPLPAAAPPAPRHPLYQLSLYHQVNTGFLQHTVQSRLAKYTDHTNYTKLVSIFRLARLWF